MILLRKYYIPSIGGCEMKKTALFSGIGLGLLAISFISAFPVSASAGESDAACVFVSLENSAWIVHKNSDVKSTLKVGDALREGDRVIVIRGNKVQLAFDKACQNIVQIEGETTFTLNSLEPAKISMEKGKMFALLDNLPQGSQFSIQTPTAIAAVRGTRYQVNTVNDQSNVFVYRGEVGVNALGSSGEITGPTLGVIAGQKTSVIGVGQAPLPPAAMTDEETGEIAGVVQSVAKTRKTVDPKQMEAWTTQGSAAPNAEVSKKQEDADSSTDSQKGKVVF